MKETILKILICIALSILLAVPVMLIYVWLAPGSGIDLFESFCLCIVAFALNIIMDTLYILVDSNDRK